MEDFKQYAVFDLETTGGLDPEIIEIGIITFQVENHSIKILESYDALVQPFSKVPERIFKLTGIEKAELENAKTFSDQAEHIERILRDKILIAHDIDQDYPLIKKELEKHLSKPFTRQTRCTLEISRQILPHLKSYALADLCDLYQIKGIKFHRAFEDTLATMKLLQYWIREKRIPEFEKVDTISSQYFKILQAFPDFAHHEIFDNKYEGAGTLFLYEENRIIFMKVLTDFEKEFIPLLVSLSDKKKHWDESYQFSRFVFRPVDNELVAHFDLYFLKKKYRPKLNRLMEDKNEWAIYKFKDNLGLLRFKVRKRDLNRPPLLLVSSKRKGVEIIRELLRNEQTETVIAGDQKDILTKEQIRKKNLNRIEFIKKYDYPHTDLDIVGPGRDKNEESVVRIVGGMIESYGRLVDNEFIEEKKIKENPEIKKITLSFLKNLRNRKNHPYTLKQKKRASNLDARI